MQQTQQTRGQRELSTAEQVDAVIANLPTLIEQARGRGDKIIPLLILDDKIAKAPLLSLAGFCSKLSLGLAGSCPRGRQDLKDSAYERLWDHLSDQGLEPRIELRGTDPHVLFSFICGKVPDAFSS